MAKNRKDKYFVWILTSLVITLTVVSNGFGDTQKDSNGQPFSVVMPLKDFYDLYSMSKIPEPLKAYDFAYKQAIYKGIGRVEKETYYIDFTSSIQVTTYSDHPLLVPVFNEKSNLESVTLDDRPAVFHKKNGMIYILVANKGEHTIKALFSMSFDATRWPRHIELSLAPIPKSEIVLNVPDTDIEATFSKGVVIDTIKQSDRELIKGYVPAVDHVEIKWLKRNQIKETIPLKMVATSHTYISLAENGAQSKSDILFRILQGQTNLFKIRVPQGIDILDVTPANPSDPTTKISQWYTEHQDNDKNLDRIIYIYTAYRQNESFRVKLSCERTEVKPNYQFNVPHILPESIDRFEHLVAVGSESNVEISEKSTGKVEPRDVRFIPEQIKQFSGTHALFYYKTLNNAFNLDFEVKSHEKAPVVQTRIARLKVDSIVIQAGTIMNKATYEIQNNQAQFLKIKLPEDSRLLSAFLDGKEIQPAFDRDVVLLPITKSLDKIFSLEIAWVTRSSAYKVFGKQSLKLPETKINIGELTWNLHTPDEYQVYYFGGNIDRKTYDFQTRMNWLLGQVFESRGSVALAGMSKSDSKSYEYKAEGLRNRFKSQGYWAKEEKSDFSSAQVKVQIPVIGKTYRFESYLVKGFTPQISCYYFDHTVQKMIAILFGLIALIGSVWILGLIFEKDNLFQWTKRMDVCLTGLGVILLSLSMMIVFSLGITAWVVEAVSFALIGFAIWQNRQEANRCRLKLTDNPTRLPNLFLTGLVAATIFLIMIDALALAGFVSLVSIIWHAVFFAVYFHTVDQFSKQGGKTRILGTNGLTVFVILVLVCGGAFSQKAMADEPYTMPQSDNATITLKWQDVEQILNQIAHKEKTKDQGIYLPFMLGTANIDGEISEHYADLILTVPITLVSDQYVKIPLFPATTSIKEALFDGKPLVLNQDHGMVYFETGKGMVRSGIIKLRLMVPVTEKGGVKEFTLSSPIIQGGVVHLTFGTDIKSVRLYGVFRQNREGRNIVATLGQSSELKGELATFMRKKESADETQKRVSKMYSTTYTLVSIEDQIATFYSSVRYRLLNKNVKQFQITLPKQVVVHEIIGDDLEKWALVKTQNNLNTYQADVLYPVAEKYDLSIQYEMPLAEAGSLFSLPCLLVEDVARDTGYIGLEMQTQSEITLKNMNKVRPIDIRELPQIIKADAISPFVFALRYVERPYDIAFDIHKNKTFQMDPAIADQIQYTHVISPQGRVMAQARIWVRNNRKQYAAITLPKGAKLVSAFLDDKSIKPSMGENRELLLPLKRQSQDPFILDLVYEGNTMDLSNLGGEIQLAYPAVDLPASIVTSDIYIPKHLSVANVKGSFQKIKTVGFIPWASGLFSNNQTTDTENSVQADIAMFGQNMANEQHLAQNAVVGNVGTHSLKINLPKQGVKLSLSTFYVQAHKVLQTRLSTLHHFIFQGGYLFAILINILVGCVLYFKHRQLFFWVVGLLLCGGVHYFYGLFFKAILYNVIIGMAIIWTLKKLRSKFSLGQVLQS